MDQAKVEALQKEFPRSVLKKTTGTGGDFWYIPSSYCEARLDQVFGGEWSFRIIGPPLVGEDWICVTGELAAGGQVHQDLGSKKITIRKGTDKPLNIAEDILKAATNAFKRCCRQYGIGRYLIIGETGGSQQRPPAASQSRDKPPPPNEPNRQTTPDTARERPPTATNSAGITAEQAKRIRLLREHAGITPAQLEQASRRDYKCPTKALSERQAAQLIRQLEGHIHEHGLSIPPPATPAGKP